MYQKDYILRMIEMMGDMLAALFGLIRKKKFKEATQTLEDMYYNVLKEDAVFFQNIPIEELTEKLIHEHNYTQAHIEILAELFNAEGALWSAQNNNDSGALYYAKALVLFEFLEKESKSFSMERQQKIYNIKQKLEHFQS